MSKSLKIPKIKYCKRCVLPSTPTAPLSFDSNGVCMGCIVHDQKLNINWDDRLKQLIREVEKYRKSYGYECIIPVSGGKDSYYQTHFVINKLKLKPLLVTYNGNNYLEEGWKNLMNMKEVFNVDHIIISPSIDLLKRFNLLGFTKTGDMNWHNHCGILTAPVQIAVKYNIPLMFWGEHGWTDQKGMYSMNDFPEFTYRYRTDQGLRGYDWYDFLDDEEFKIDENELELYKYPSDEEIKKIGVKGLHMNFYDPWKVNENTEMIIKKYNWTIRKEPFERTYRKFSNLDDRYENGAHDYLKFIKVGYGRATDHATKDIRAGIMTREKGIEMVRKYDHVKSKDIYHWLKYVNKNEVWFDKIADTFRNDKVWLKDENGNWHKSNIWD